MTEFRDSLDKLFVVVDEDFAAAAAIREAASFTCKCPNPDAGGVE
jgi:hypothetical protein